MADERIDKFFDDCAHVIDGGSAAKISTEVRHLAKWMQKHQEDRATDSAKGKLFSTVQSYYKFALRPDVDERVHSMIHELIDSYLKIPEGKLVSAKNKQSAMKWLETLRSKNIGSLGGSDLLAERVRYVVMEVRGRHVSAMKSDTNEMVEDLDLSPADKLTKLLDLFADSGYAEFEEVGGFICGVFDEDGTEV
jgi:hypothetical protein